MTSGTRGPASARGRARHAVLIDIGPAIVSRWIEVNQRLSAADVDIQRAIAIDPTLAPAYAGLANAMLTEVVLFQTRSVPTSCPFW